MRRRLTAGLLTAGLLLLTAGQAAASPTVFAAVNAPSYFSRFKQYWGGTLAAQNGVTMIVVLCGIVSLIIITRGKWKR